jgi:hypothetical protein
MSNDGWSLWALLFGLAQSNLAPMDNYAKMGYGTMTKLKIQIED